LLRARLRYLSWTLLGASLAIPARHLLLRLLDGATRVDKAVSAELLRVMQPLGMDAAVNAIAAQETEARDSLQRRLDIFLKEIDVVSTSGHIGGPVSRASSAVRPTPQRLHLRPETRLHRSDPAVSRSDAPPSNRIGHLRLSTGKVN